MANSPSPLNRFTLKLFNKLAAGKNENFFISPFSISTALAMCQVGARGETAAQLKKLLKVDHLNDQQILELNQSYLTTINQSLGQSVKINTANKIYPHRNFQIHQEFIDLLSKYFHSEVQTVNFANGAETANIINTWVSDKTNHKIKDLISPSVLNDLTRLVLVNAIYFKGDWLHKFDSVATSKEDFHLSDGTKTQVEMMKLYKKKFRYLYRPNGVDVSILELPYIGENISMTIVLPHPGYSLQDIEKRLDDNVLQEILTGHATREPIRLHLPKFKLQHKQELSDPLKELGAVLPFSEAHADFTGITSEPTGLYISKVIHEAVVEVNEEGTEAAAATAVIMLTRCAVRVEEPYDFICDRPFIFIIHDKVQHNVLFYGKYLKPE